MKADVGLQVAAVDYGDWDMHTDMGTVQSGWLHDKLDELSRSLDAFATDLGAKLGDVTLVTLTEFGRSLVENGSGGVDHGHGQAVLLLGGGVQGGQVHGTWPTLEPGALAGGDLAGTTDYRQILAEILEKRCEGSEISTVFPGVSSRPARGGQSSGLTFRGGRTRGADGAKAEGPTGRGDEGEPTHPS